MESDVEDWRPDGTGTRRPINCDRWQGDSLKWFLYWMQNLPGADNRLRFRNKPVENWWVFLGDFDAAMNRRMKLVAE